MRIQLIAFITLLAINFGVDLYIYKRIIKRYIQSVGIRLSFWIINVLIIFGVFYVIRNIKTGNETTQLTTLMWFLFIYFCIYTPKIVYFLISIFDYIPYLFKKKKIRIFSYSGLVVAAIVLVSMIYGGTIGRQHILVNEVPFHSQRIPASFDGYRIVQLSDIHLGNYEKTSDFVDRIVEETNRIQPDLIVFTGDLVNLRTDELTPYIDILSQLKARDGVYSILGNHDYGDYVRWTSEADKLKNLETLIIKQKNMGWKMLNNESDKISRNGDTIQIVGVENWGEPPFPQRGDLKKALQGTDDSRFTLLLTHNPVHWDQEVLGKSAIDLSMAGHTHAMQLKLVIGKLRISPSALAYRRWSGMYTENNQSLYVNEGLGYVFLPMRIGASPEITVIELKAD